MCCVITIKVAIFVILVSVSVGQERQQQVHQANITTAAAAAKSGLLWLLRVPLDAPDNVEAVLEKEDEEMGSKINWNSKQQDVRTWRIAKSWSPKKRMGQVYSEWTPWTSCDEECRQRRERFCVVPRKCSETKHLVEERRCAMLLCKEREDPSTEVTSEAKAAASQHHHHHQPHHVQTTGGHHSQQQTNNNMSARHSVLESSGGSRSAGESTVANKFIPKSSRRDMRDHESEFQIIKINHKKAPSSPETRANKFDFARPVTTAIQIIETTIRPPIINGSSSSAAAIDGGIDGFDAEPTFPSLFGAMTLDNGNNDESDNDYADNNDDYPTTGIVHFHRRKYKNGPMMSKKYAPMNNFVTNAATAESSPKGAYRVYTRWSKWSKCSGKCTTRRFKKCRMKEICGSEVLREVAYCYTEGSFCEEWIVRQMYSNVPKSPPIPQYQAAPLQPQQSQHYPTAMVQHQQYAVDQQRGPNNYQERKLPLRLSGTAAAAAPGQCGVATAVGNRRKPASHMLRIIGGRVVRRGSYPWQVAILNRFKEAFCGGTLISKQWILTAAHCVRKRLYVRLGEHNLEERDGTEVEYRVEYAIRNPYYDKTTVDNDIALLRLPKEIIPSAYIGFACLPAKYQRLPVGTKCTIIGWGKRKNLDDAGTKYLHEAQVPIVQNEECKEVYDDYTITKNMFCAGHKRGRIDTCSGDSGGPLLCKDPNTAHWSILGVTSFGDGCGKRNKFGIYTKVSNYVDWIQSVIECNGNCRRF